MYLIVISKPHRGEGLAPLGLSSNKKNPLSYINNKKNPLSYINNKKVLVSRHHHELKEFYREEFNNFKVLNNDTNSILWNNQQMRQCAVKFISLQVHSTYFGRYTRPSSGVQS